MSKLYDDAKRQYQKYLAKREAAEKERGETVVVSDTLGTAAVPLCFGVIGTGHVFDRWMHDVQMLPASAGVRVKGVVAGRSDAAQKKAQQYDIPTVYPDYASMLQDEEIRAVYVATPNHLHREHVISALRAGKHVLCEKPIAVNTTELQEMYEAADAADCFLMEGMWMRTLPMIRELVKVVQSGEIGAVRCVETACCNSNSMEAFPALYSAEKAGGALMDIGCYGLHFVRLLFSGDPEMKGYAISSPTGVDHTSSVMLRYDDSVAVVTQSIGAAGGARAILHGTKGSIEVPLFLSPEGFTVTGMDGFKTHYRYEKEKEARPIGYAYEILHFAECISKGLRDSDLIPRSETLAVAAQTEQIRKENGIRLGGELREA